MWTEPKTALYAEPHATALKKQFAAAWVRQPDNAFAAAREVEQHVGMAAYIAQQWIEDEQVLAFRADIIAERGPIAKVPTKEEFAVELYTVAREAKAVGDKLRAYEFFAKVMGYVDTGRSEGGVNVNIMNAPKIMAVPLAASDEEWQVAALNHQKVLQSRHG